MHGQGEAKGHCLEFSPQFFITQATREYVSLFLLWVQGEPWESPILGIYGMLLYNEYVYSM